MVATVGTLSSTKNALATPVVTRTHTAAAQVVPAAGLQFTLPVGGLKRLMVQLTSAVAALTGFTVGAVPVAGGVPSTIASVTADYTAPKGLIVGTSGDLTVLNGAGYIILDVEGLDSIVLTATSAGTATLALTAGGA